MAVKVHDGISDVFDLGIDGPTEDDRLHSGILEFESPRHNQLTRRRRTRLDFPDRNRHLTREAAGGPSMHPSLSA